MDDRSEKKKYVVLNKAVRFVETVVDRLSAEDKRKAPAVRSAVLLTRYMFNI